MILLKDKRSKQRSRIIPPYAINPAYSIAATDNCPLINHKEVFLIVADDRQSQSMMKDEELESAFRISGWEGL